MAKQENQQTNEQRGGQPSREQRGGIERSRGPMSMRRDVMPRDDFMGSPFSMLRRFSEDMNRFFGRFGLFGPDPMRRGSRWFGNLEETSWPEIEVKRSGEKLVVQADVPGLKKEDVKVEVLDGELRISGERRSESERDESGVYVSERSYGSFLRTIALPEEAKPETASASFENGVLRVEIEAPRRDRSNVRQIEVR